jgi:hypothetical protein
MPHREMTWQNEAACTAYPKEHHPMSEPGHGHSTAAWTGVTLLLIASVLLSVGIFFGWSWATWSGIVLVVLGAAGWYGLHAAGYGEEWPSRKGGH